MSWSLISPQFYGLLLFLGLAFVAMIVGGIGLAWVLYQFNRARQADHDTHITAVATACVKAHISPVEAHLQRIDQNTESQHRETMTLLSEMEKRLPKADTVNDHETRIGKLESKTNDHRVEIDELFRRMRKMEIAHASQHGSQSGESDTTLPDIIPTPPTRNA